MLGVGSLPSLSTENQGAVLFTSQSKFLHVSPTVPSVAGPNPAGLMG